MTLDEFQVLSETEQAKAVWNGTYVSTRVFDDLYIQLYDLEGLYVDVYYDPLANKILHITPNLIYEAKSFGG